MQDASLWMFIVHADIVVKVVLMILLTVSVASWTIIIQRALLLRNTRRRMAEFEQTFGPTTTIKNLIQRIPEHQSELARLLHAGYREYIRCSAQAMVNPDRVIESCARAMQIAEQQSLQGLEQNVGILATIGSTAPYVGLFGTVWGIMSSFRALGGAEQLTIAMVAPGISEALIATAIGLFAAIPAVVAYNRFADQLGRIQQDLEIFQTELIGLFQQRILQPLPQQTREGMVHAEQ